MMTFEEIIAKLPNPYFQDDAVVIYCADNRDILPLIPDKSVDLVLTDPPYGIGLEYGSFEDTPENVKQLVNQVIPESIRIAKRVLLTCATRQQSFYPAPDWVLCWLNRAGAYPNPWGFTCWQPILAYGSDPYLENRMGSRSDVIEHSERAPKNGHPCPKPVNFWKLLITRGSVKDTDILLDPFLGSGTSVMASKHLGRKCIGIEIEEKYCEIAAKRCSQSVMNFGVEMKSKELNLNNPHHALLNVP